MLDGYQPGSSKLTCMALAACTKTEAAAATERNCLMVRKRWAVALLGNRRRLSNWKEIEKKGNSRQVSYRISRLRVVSAKQRRSKGGEVTSKPTEKSPGPYAKEGQRRSKAMPNEGKAILD